GFNKPHSVAYALVAYQTAWLKHYYPADFMAAVLSADMQTTDKVVVNIEESREIGLTISPPDVNRSEYRFVPDGEASVIYGLGAIKGLGEGPIEAISKARREGGPFEDLFSLCERVDARKVNKRAIEALIGAGALDGLVPDSLKQVESPIDHCRALLLANYEDAVKLAEQKARNQDSGHTDLFGMDMMVGGDNARYNHFDTLSCLSFKERLQRERDTLGLYLTGHPLDVYKAELRHLAKTRIVELRPREEQTVVGLIVAMRTMKNKKNETIAFVTLDDRSGRIEVSVFADLYEQNYARLQKDQVVVVRGSTDRDDFTGGIRMRASEVFDLQQARERSIKRLQLSLSSSALQPDFVAELVDLLAPFRGAPGQGCPVSIAYLRTDAQAEVVLGDSWRVTPADDLLERLRDRYGPETVKLDY
ncbi:MAG: DNA polymerase III subunit alpha, partial [Pseudomonadales bacterium]|nr:DNA polymerase III subunit alpha [Pseudomonadales bacterium]